ncbi:MAG: hypothetical protein LBO09_01650 [Candidatus Peribacteria bacterium]|jgi:hypothetical protein|nr:hypothetical protein [Candidatus Peribacteria bacterium]
MDESVKITLGFLIVFFVALLYGLIGNPFSRSKQKSIEEKRRELIEKKRRKIRRLEEEIRLLKM